MTTDAQSRVLSFGDFRLDCRSGELRKNKREIRLQPQPAKLLVLLASRPGEIVTRMEIQKALWGEDTFVDFEHGINFSIKQIRDALGDEAEKPRFIETVPRVGYRFVARAEALSMDGGEGRSPYPGLSSFSSSDAPFFFGREAEVESVRRKLETRKMLALIGPSGSGKTSFLKAGLVPSLSKGYRVVLFTPGSAPMRALTRTLVSEVSGDAEAVQDLTEDVVAAAARWRKRHERALVVIDAFEELFTLNPPEVQKEFASTVGRLAAEADVQVLLSVRDDFLFRCHDYEKLAPVFLDLTPLGPLKGPALRQALEQPALSCGYRFETEELVSEMLSEVQGERGALPLLAFAAAQLWERRDREKKLLTRKAYEEAGRVGGALGRHADATLDRIGPSRVPVVRELFRNLVTAQGTRASREIQELLSIFPKDDDRRAAEEVLRELVAARLLTSYDSSIEIIHESLLSAWPRLVHWRNQDEGGVLLRDQLRQAAQLWQERGWPEDALWTGSSYRELALWRERYTGGLSSTEEAFAEAATKLAGRRRRRRRMTVSAGVALLFGVALITSSLWRRAVHEASRREAAQILALGRLDLEDRPTAALAHALASLEHADNEPARRFAVEALWHGAAAIVISDNVNTVDFSPDGQWLAGGGSVTGVRLWSIEGGSPRILGGPDGVPPVAFSPRSDFLAAGGEQTARFWSLPEGDELRKVEVEGATRFRRGGSHLLSFSTTSEGTKAVRDWSVQEEGSGFLTSLDLSGVSDWDIDASGEWLLTGRGKGVYVSPLRDSSSDRSRLVGRHDANVVWVRSHPASPRIASGDETGEIRIWGFSEGSGHLERMLRAPDHSARLDPTDSWMVVTPGGGPDVAYVWDLKGPPDADPLVLRNGDVIYLNTAAIDPTGHWLVTANAIFGILWPLHSKYPRVLRGQSPPQIAVAFTPDGSGLVSTSQHDGTVRFWPLSPRQGERSRSLMEDQTANLGKFLAVDPTGRFVLVHSPYTPSVFLVPLNGGEPRRMPGFKEGEGWVDPLAFSPDGRIAVAAGWKPSLLRIWNLESGELRTLDTRVPGEECDWGKDWEGAVGALVFLADGRLLTTGPAGIRVWNLEQATSQQIGPCTDKEVESYLATDLEHKLFLFMDRNPTAQLSALTLFDAETGSFKEITSHGNRVSAATLDPKGTIAVTGSFDGVVRVGPVTGEEPHLLYGHTLEVSSVAVSPDGKWVASGSQDGTIRLWPMPEGTPFHTLPYEELLSRIRALTNLRVVPDESSGTGYRVSIGAFPGWKTPPAW